MKKEELKQTPEIEMAELSNATTLPNNFAGNHNTYFQSPPVNKPVMVLMCDSNIVCWHNLMVRYLQSATNDSEIVNTMGLNFTQKNEIINGQSVKLQFFRNTSYSRIIEPQVTHPLDNTNPPKDILLFCYDRNNIDSYHSIRGLLENNAETIKASNAYLIAIAEIDNPHLDESVGKAMATEYAMKPCITLNVTENKNAITQVEQLFRTIATDTLAARQQCKNQTPADALAARQQRNDQTSNVASTWRNWFGHN